MSGPAAWGPFLPNVEPAERLARLRGLRVAVRLICGTRGRDVEAALRQAERNDAALPNAEREFDRLASLDRRRILSSFGSAAL